MILAAMLIGGFLSLSQGITPQIPHLETSERVVVLDPGHGGIDGGTSGSGLVEKNVTLDLAKRVAAQLPKNVFSIYMTRTSDTDVSGLYPSTLSGRHKRDLQNRLTFVRQSRAVAVISIHINSSVKERDRGPIVFYAVNSESSKEFAQSMQQALNQVARSTQRPVGRKNLFLLRHSPFPAILVEVGFITNASDAVRLKNPAYREQVATAMAHVILLRYRHAEIPAPYQKQP